MTEKKFWRHPPKSEAQKQATRKATFVGLPIVRQLERTTGIKMEDLFDEILKEENKMPLKKS
jgi:hypothetical protein